MPTLTLRNLSADDLRWLRGRAAAHARSVNAELLDLVAVARADELAAQHPKSEAAKTYLRARALGVRTPSTSTSILRADRDRDLGYR